MAWQSVRSYSVRMCPSQEEHNNKRDLNDDNAIRSWWRRSKNSRTGGALCNLPVEDSSSSSSASTRTPLIIMVQHATTRPSVQYMDGWSLVVMRQSFPATNTQTPSTTTQDDISRFVNAKLMVRSFIIFRDHFCYNPQYNYGLYGIIIIPPSVHVAAFWSEWDWNGCASCCSSKKRANL